MDEYKNWVTAQSNIGKTNFGGEISGIPNKKHSYLYECPETLFDFAFFDEELYVIDSLDTAYCIKLAEGNDVLACIDSDHAGVDDSCSLGALIFEDKLLLGNYIINRVNGSLIGTITDLLAPDSIEPEGVCFFYKDKIIRLVIYDRKKKDHRLVLLDLEAKSKKEIVKIELEYVSNGLIENLFLGWDGSYLKCLDIENKEYKWTIKVPDDENGKRNADGNVAIFGERAYVLVGNETIWCIDILKGEKVWQFGIDINEGDSRFDRYRIDFAISNNTVHVVSYDDYSHEKSYLISLDAKTGELLWRFDGEMLSHCCVAGDLVFGGLDRKPTAWDKYTGEQVWQASRTVSINRASANHKMVLYFAGMDTFVGYKYKKDYISPARP